MKQISIGDIIQQQELSWKQFLKSSPEERKKKWEEFKCYYPEEAEYYEDGEGCNDDITCQYFKDGWCSLQELPAAFNLYLTPRTGMIGMACMGMKPKMEV